MFHKTFEIIFIRFLVHKTFGFDVDINSLYTHEA